MDLTNSIVIPENDLSCMLQQGEDETNTMIAGMLSLISENEKLNEGLQNQSWCKRMFNTVIGKNKATASEIRQNHDKLDAYIAQAVSMLYDRNRISSQIMVSLGLQINQLYNSHLELKGTLYTLASKLNEKIESVDNFHTLMEEIDEGIYGNEPSITALLSIISQIDGRMVSDSKKMRLLERKLFSKDLLCSDNKLSIEDFLLQIADLQNDDLGTIYADLQLYREDYILISLAIDVIESWNLLAVSNRRLLRKKTIIERIIRETEVDESSEISLDEFYDEMVGLRQNLFSEAKPLLTEPQDTVHDNNNEHENILTDSPSSRPIYSSIRSIYSSICSEEKEEEEEEEEEEKEGEENEEETEEESNEDIDIGDIIANAVSIYLGWDDSCVTYTDYIPYDVLENAKKNIVDHKDILSGGIGGVLGTLIGGPAGGLIGAGLGNMAKSTQQFTCDMDDIVAVVDSSTSKKCKEGLVFTREGVFLSEAGSVSKYIPYDDIYRVSGTNGILGGKLQVERYSGDNFTWNASLIPKDKVALILDEIKRHC